MENQLYQTLEVLDHLDTSQEWWPFLNQLVDSKSDLNVSDGNTQVMLTSFFQECLLKLKEYKETISAQETDLKVASHELISQKEDNSQLAEVNHCLMGKIAELKDFLDEADATASTLRAENTNLKEENQAIKSALECSESSEKELYYMSPLGKYGKQPSEKKFQLGGSQDTNQSVLLELEGLRDTVKRQNTTIDTFAQEIEDLLDYKEKFQALSKDLEISEAIRQQNIKLQEDMALLSEELEKTKNEASNNLALELKQLKSFESRENKNDLKVSTDWNSLNSKEDDYINKNALLKKSSLPSSPTKFNVDFKRQSLLMETILFTPNNSQRVSIVKSRRNSGEKLTLNKDQKGLKELTSPNITSLGNISNLDSTENILPKISEASPANFVLKEVNTDRSLKLNSENNLDKKEIKSEQKNLKEIQEKSFNERDVSVDGSLGRNEEYCFEGMLSWEEGDFPQLESPGISCSPKINWESEEQSLMTKASQNLDKIINTVNKENEIKVFNTEKDPIVSKNKAMTKTKPKMKDYNSTSKKAGKEKRSNVREKIQNDKESKSRKLRTEIENKPKKTCESRAVQTDEPQSQSYPKVENIVAKESKKNLKVATWIFWASPVLVLTIIALFLFFYRRINIFKC